MTDNDRYAQLTSLAACTLPTAQRPTRLAEFDDFFGRAVAATARPSATRLELRLRADGDAERMGRDLAARESTCCAFFTFTFTADAAGTVMGIEVPVTHLDILDALAVRVAGAGR
ncbi:hypothetical protein [Nocardia sp. BMG111209]|uniref:hypothetical protein n=1 Tax=Nocardia sp. BMG111209 TaxID=1160137 RepID=UPI00035ECB21|nr:hypothetical protein [Nocardia sp. BMG111209]